MVKGSRRRAPRLGQNFLVDRVVCERIVDWAGARGRSVVEIGPGRGALTGLLADHSSKLLAIELDSTLAAKLAARYDNSDHVRVLQADALAVDLDALLDEPCLVVGNLPYESGTAIVRHLLEQHPPVEEMVVMLQKEVCQRLLSGPGSRSYGVLSVMTGMYADVEAGLEVGPESFDPAPAVDSMAIRISCLDGPRYDPGDEALFAELVKAAFVSRRKMLGNTLVKWIDARLGEGSGSELIEEAGIDSGCRAEQVEIEKLAALCRGLHRREQRSA